MTFEETMNQTAQLLPLSGSAVEDHASIPIWRKLLLTVPEAIAYTGIGDNNIRKIIQNDIDGEYTLRVGRKILIKRRPFETYLESLPYI